jgi:hypothetical protein
MRVGHGVEVSDNVQIVVDHKHKLVVEHEVTNEVIPTRIDGRVIPANETIFRKPDG